MLHLGVDALEVHGVQADSEHHDLHHAKGRNQQALERGALLGYLGSRRALGRHRLWLVAQVCERGKVRGKLGAFRGEAKAQAVCDRIHLSGCDAGLFAQGGLDQPAASGAVHATDINRRFADVIVLFSECAEHVRTIEDAPLGSVFRWPADPGVRRVAEVVIAGHARVADEFGDSLASRATDRMMGVPDFYGEMAVSRDRQRAMETGVSAHQCRPA